MESVYEHRKYRLLYTKKVDLKQFFFNYAQIINPFFKIRKKGDGLKALLNIDNDEEYVKLKQKMDPNKAKNVHVPKSYIPKRRFLESWSLYDLPTCETRLVTLNNLKLETREEKYKRMRGAKYFGKIILEEERDVDDVHRCRSLHALLDYTVCVRVESILDYSGTKKYSPSQELWVPGRVSLEKIKDRIICQEDYELAQPVIESPHQRHYKRKMELNKHGMFYIDNNFYVDRRWGEEPQHDYSIEVRKWMLSRNMEPGAVRNMQRFCIKDLNIRMGYPYLFIHQGKCEHLIIFTDARMLKHQDLLFLEDYPLLKSFASLRGRYCILCLNRLAKLCVTNCAIIPYDVAFICNMCAFSYLYDSDGKKKSDFILYKYIDRSAII